MKPKTCFAVLSLFAFAGSSAPLPAMGQVAPDAQSNGMAAEDAQTAVDLGHAAERRRLVTRPDELVSVLDNGLTVICRQVASPVVAVRVHVKTGGAFEGPWLGGGLSHLLEHLVAGGSTADRTEAENRALLQKIGNNSNAYTSDDETVYYINTTPNHYESAVDLLTGWVFGALITPDEYAREREVVQRELEMGKGDPRRQMYYMSTANRYRVSPLRVPVIGYESVIQGLTRDDIYDYFKLKYQPQNMVVSVAGNLEPAAMLAAVQAHVRQVPGGREVSADLPPEPPVLTPRTAVATFPKLGQARVQLAFPSFRLDHPDLYALDLLASVLAGGDSSPLVSDLRDGRQLVSSVNAYNQTPSYVEGTFAINLETDADKLDAAVAAVMDHLEKAKQGQIDPAAVARAKTQMRVGRYRGMQTTEDISSSMAQDYITTGDPHFSDAYVERVDRVTPEQLQEVANRWLNPDRLVKTVLLPAESAPEGLTDAVSMLAAAESPEPKADAAAGEVVRSVLPDGTILLVKRIATSPMVSIRMMSLGGVTAETKDDNGIGHFTMQLASRGTQSLSAEELNNTLDAMGADLETQSGNNSWTWHLSCTRDDLERGLDLLIDTFARPAMAESEVQGIRKRIAAEIDGQDANWTSQAMRFFRSSYFGESDNPYQFAVIGRKENLDRFTAADAAAWHAGTILKAPRVLSVFGDVSPAKVAELVTARLAGLESVPPPPAFPPQAAGVADDVAREAAGDAGAPGAAGDASADTAGVDVRRVDVLPTQQKLAGIFIGFDSRSIAGESADGAITLADTLTSGPGFPTGYLHETLRGKGLVYVVHAYNWRGASGKTPGAFVVYAGCDPSKVNEVVDAILLNLARLQGTDSDVLGGETPADGEPDWFARAKVLTELDEAMSAQSASEQTLQAGVDELFGLGYDYADRLPERIGKLDIDAVRQAARQRLASCVVTVSTPEPGQVNVQTGRRTYDAFPPVDLTPEGVEHAPVGGQ